VVKILEVKEIPIEKIQTMNIRQDLGDYSELKESIKEDGLEIPIKVRYIKDPNYIYEAVDGNRRIEIYKELGKTSIPAIIEEKADEEALFSAYRINMQRGDYTWLDEGIFFNKLQNQGLNQTEIARKIKKSRDYVQNRIYASRIIETAPQGAIKLDMRVAEEITYADPKDQPMFVEKAIKENLTKDEVRKLVQQGKKIQAFFDMIYGEKIADELFEFYHPRRFVKGAFDSLYKEYEIRTLKAESIDKFLDANEYTEEQAKEYAKKHHGEFKGLEVMNVYHVYVIPDLVEDLRKKIEDNV
jgi:ParB/RepB/Spo0J family partition protein